MTYVPDVNVCSALTFEAHVHHRHVAAWFEAATEHCVFTRLTQMGFLHLCSNPRVFGDEAVTLAGAWRLYDALLADPRISFAEETPNLFPLWRAFTQRQTYSPKVWNDAYLAAFSCGAQHELITFDRDFRQFPGLKLSLLL